MLLLTALEELQEYDRGGRRLTRAIPKNMDAYRKKIEELRATVDPV